MKTLMTKEERRLKHNEGNKRYRKRNPERKREQNRRYNLKHPGKTMGLKVYGLTSPLYDKLLSEQNGVCAICGKTNSFNRRLAIDHDHETKEIRGLLCYKCNVGLGFFCDDRDLLMSAICYLKK